MRRRPLPVGCSKRPAFSPTQPSRTETRPVPSKAAANYHFIRGGCDDPTTCAQCSYPPTHWQIFFTHPTLRLLRNRFPGTCQYPRRGASEAARCASTEDHQAPSLPLSPCAFCEQEGHLATPFHYPIAFPIQGISLCNPDGWCGSRSTLPRDRTYS